MATDPFEEMKELNRRLAAAIRGRPVARRFRSRPVHTARKQALAGWFDVNWERRETIPDRSGCYAVYLNGRLAYIGYSDNIQKRLASYRLRWGYGGSIFSSWGCCRTVRIKVRVSRRYGEGLMREARLLRRLRPGLNFAGCGRKGSERRGVVPAGVRPEAAPEDPAPGDALGGERARSSWIGG